MDPQLFVFAFVMLLARIGAFLIVFPLFGRGFLPQSVKFGFCLALAFVWLPQFKLAPSVSVSWVALGFGITREVIIGSALGFVLGLMLLPMRMAGVYVGQEMGYNLSGITAPGSSSSSNEIGIALESLGILIFFATDTHHTVLAALFATIAHPGVVDNLRSYALGHFAHGLNQAHEISVLIVAPISICLFATTVVLGVAMKAVPNVNLFSVGIPARFAVGFVSLLVFMPDVLQHIAKYFQSQQDIFSWLF